MTIASMFLALIVTSAADPSSGEPVLLDFHASWCGPCQTMRPEIAKLARKKYPIRSVDIDRSRDLAERYDVKAVPTFIVADGQGRVLARTQGVTTAAELASLYNDAKLKAADSTGDEPRQEVQATTNQAADDPADEATPEPAEPPLVNPKPWETVVRIKMHLSNTEWGFGSGTIIYSDAEESIILTCAHIFRDKNQRAQALKNFKTRIAVDLFDGKITNLKHAQLRCVEKDIPGEAIDYDFNSDVGLIRIRPGRRLPASRVVPDYWQPEKGMKMYSVGCSHGEDATAWDTKILDPRVKMNNNQTKQSFFEMKCAFQPSEGRSGGGLYTTDGYVAGVCDFADPNERTGLYAVPSAIHRLLDRNQLMALYKAPADGSGQMLAAAARSRTKVRAQSPSDTELGPTEAQNFTIPDPGMFKIATPETKVASNQNRAKTWQTSDLEETPRPARSNRRPERDAGEAIDPGATPGMVVPTDVPLEPNSDAGALDLPEPKATPRQPAAQVSTRPGTSSKWKGVHTTRPRPSD